MHKVSSLYILNTTIYASLHLHLYSGNIDYTSVSASLTLSFGSQRVCRNINISNDNIVEIDKIFSIVLSTTDERLGLSRDRAEVVIINDDCELETLKREFLTFIYDIFALQL